jgi:hypothetical protein
MGMRFSGIPGGGGALLIPTGTAAGDAALINNDVAAVMANTYGGVIDMAAGTWNLAGGAIPPINANGKSVTFRWAPGALIRCSGAGDILDLHDSSNLVTRQIWGGGILGAPTFDGTGTTGAACPVHMGDITQLGIFAQAQNFLQPGSLNFHPDNRFWWSEQMYGRLVSQSGLVLCQFDNSTGQTNPNATGSFDGLAMETYLNQNGLGNGVVWNGGAFAIRYKLKLSGNFKPGASQFWALSMLGQNSLNPSSLGVGGGDGAEGLYIGLECDGSVGTLPGTIQFQGAPFTFINSSGNLSFSNFAQSNNSGGHFQMQGSVVGDPSLPTVPNLTTPSQAQTITANGSTIFIQWYGNVLLTMGASFTGAIMQAGGFDGQEVTVINNSANTLTFAVAGTSHVADGVADVIPALAARTFKWSAVTSLWYRIA